MRKILMIVVLLTAITISTNAQDYRNAIGLRAGYPAGLTFKHSLSRKAVFEALLSTRWRGFEITGLYEATKQAFDIDRLNWYYGFGAHVGFWNGRYAYWGDTGTQYTVVGIDGILGIEYNFVDIPINIGLDWKPAFNIVGYTGFWGDGAALSLRYTF